MKAAVASSVAGRERGGNGSNRSTWARNGTSGSGTLSRTGPALSWSSVMPSVGPPGPPPAARIAWIAASSSIANAGALSGAMRLTSSRQIQTSDRASPTGSTAGCWSWRKGWSGVAVRSVFSYQVVAGSTMSAHSTVWVRWWSTATTRSQPASVSCSRFTSIAWTNRFANVQTRAWKPSFGYGTAGFIVSVGPRTKYTLGTTCAFVSPTCHHGAVTTRTLYWPTYTENPPPDRPMFPVRAARSASARPVRSPWNQWLEPPPMRMAAGLVVA